MILNNCSEELEVRLRIRVEGFDYLLFVSSAAMKCFGCGLEEHKMKMCPLWADTSAAAVEPGQDGGAPCGSRERRSKPEPQPAAVKLCTAPRRAATAAAAAVMACAGVPPGVSAAGVVDDRRAQTGKVNSQNGETGQVQEQTSVLAKRQDRRAGSGR